MARRQRNEGFSDFMFGAGRRKSREEDVDNPPLMRLMRLKQPVWAESPSASGFGERTCQNPCSARSPPLR